MSVQLLWELHALFSEGVYKPLVHSGEGEAQDLGRSGEAMQ